MITGQLEDEEPHPDDLEIWTAIKKASKPVPSDGKSIRIGIRNADANIYRVVASDDRMEMANIDGALGRMGFTAERAEGSEIERGFSLVYDRPPKPLVTYFRPSGHRSRRR